MMKHLLVLIFRVAMFSSRGLAGEPAATAGTEQVFYATIDQVEQRIAETNRRIEEAKAKYPGFQSKYIQGANYYVAPEVLFYTEELQVYTGMKTLLEDGLPKKDAVGYEHAQRVVGQYELLEKQKKLKRAWDEHAQYIESKKPINMNSKEPIVIQVK